MTLDITKVRPLRGRVVVRRYEKPETVHGLIIPEPWREDATQSLWELVSWAPDVEEELGIALTEGTIIQTRPYRGVALGDGIHRVLKAEDIINIILWEEAG